MSPHSRSRATRWFGAMAVSALALSACSSDRGTASPEPSATAETAVPQLLAGAASRIITPQGWEPFTDTNQNNRYDDGEPFDDLNGDGELTTMLIAGDARPDGRRVINDVRDDLMVTVTVVDDGERRIALAGIDLASMSLDLTERVRAGLADRDTQIDSLVLSASHSHESFDPDPTADRFSPAFEEAYWESVVDATVDAVVEAAERAEPVRLELAAASASLEAGNSLQADVRAPNIIDDRITAMNFIGDDGPVATVVNFGSHPEMLLEDDVVTSDYPGQVRRRIEAEFPGSIAVWLSGAFGSQITSEDASFSYAGTKYPDTDPSPWAGGSAEKGDAVGNAVADLMIDALATAAVAQSDCGISDASTTTIYVPVENAEILSSLGPNPSVDDAPVPILFADGSPQSGTIDLTQVHIGSEVGLVRICGAAILATPFEVAPEQWLGCYDGSCANPDHAFMGETNPTAGFTEFPDGPYLRDLVDAPFPMVTSLTNDGLGYAVVPAAFALHPEQPWENIWTEHHYDEISSLSARAAPVLDAATRELTGTATAEPPPAVAVDATTLDRYVGPWGERVTFDVVDGRLRAEVPRFGTTVDLIAISETEFVDPVLGISVEFKVDVEGQAVSAMLWSPGEGAVALEPGAAVNVAFELGVEIPTVFVESEPGLYGDGESMLIVQQVTRDDVEELLAGFEGVETTEVVAVADRQWTITETDADSGRALLATTTDGDAGLVVAIAPLDGDLTRARATLEDVLATAAVAG